MNIEIKQLENKEEIRNVILEPKLWKLTYGQGCLVEEFEIDSKCKYLSVQHNNELVGMFELKEFNKIMYEGHIYMLPEYGKLGVNAIKAAKEYLSETTNFLKIFTTVPMECNHVHRLLQKAEFEMDGVMSNSIIYNDRLQDLVLYSTNIRG
jgi:RimJ/RimL family protein N-acetyltransferase